MILDSLKTGIRDAIRHWELTAVLLAVSVIFAAPIAIPFVSTIIETTAFRADAGRLLADRLDPSWLIDFANEQFPGISLASFSTQVILLFIAMFVGFLVSNVILAGGVIEVLLDGRFSMKRFLGGAGTFFWRFIRLWLISLVIYAGLVFVYLIVFATIVGFEETAGEEGPAQIAKWVAMFILVGAFGLVNMVFAYARIATAVHHGSSMIRESLLATKFVLQRLRSVSVLYLLVLVLGLAIFALLTGLRGLVSQSSLTTSFLALVIGQLAITGRVWARVAAYGSQLHLYRALTPSIEPGVPMLKLTPEFAAAVEETRVP